MDQPIEEYFEERKQAWLKKNTKASMTDVELRELEQEGERVFSAEEWLPNAAKRAAQISMATHPVTYSHPSARKNKNGYASAVIACNPKSNDGFLRSGNVQVETDALGNAAAIDVYKFLTLVMDDGQTLLSHIEQETSLAKKLLAIKAKPYEELRNGFLAMTDVSKQAVTSSKIKQVYFPVEGAYHLLSLLSPSGIMFEMRQRLDALRFSDETKTIREKRKERKFSEDGYKEILNLTTIGFGGTKPQNISILNNQNGGKTHLLMSAPPAIKQRNIRFPTRDFFKQSLNYFSKKDIWLSFHELHSLYERDKNNFKIRNQRDAYYQALVDWVIETLWQVRSVASEQYHASSSSLSTLQKRWLLPEHEDFRKQDDDWLDDVVNLTARFIFHGYEAMLRNKAFKFSDGELRYMKSIVEKNREGLR